MAGMTTLGRSDETGKSAMTSTLGPTSSIAGARMNTPRQVLVPPSFSANLGTTSSISKLCNCVRKFKTKILSHQDSRPFNPTIRKEKEGRISSSFLMVLYKNLKT